ncbi:MAG: hypothetical protein AAF183_24520, partial [Pseudomonadota bacterium]
AGKGLRQSWREFQTIRYEPKDTRFAEHKSAQGQVRSMPSQRTVLPEGYFLRFIAKYNIPLVPLLAGSFRIGWR